VAWWREFVKKGLAGDTRSGSNDWLAVARRSVLASQPGGSCGIRRPETANIFSGLGNSMADGAGGGRPAPDTRTAEWCVHLGPRWLPTGSCGRTHDDWGLVDRRVRWASARLPPTSRGGCSPPSVPDLPAGYQKAAARTLTGRPARRRSTPAPDLWRGRGGASRRWSWVRVSYRPLPLRPGVRAFRTTVMPQALWSGAFAGTLFRPTGLMIPPTTPTTTRWATCRRPVTCESSTCRRPRPTSTCSASTPDQYGAAPPTCWRTCHGSPDAVKRWWPESQTPLVRCLRSGRVLTPETSITTPSSLSTVHL